MKNTLAILSVLAAAVTSTGAIAAESFTPVFEGPLANVSPCISPDGSVVTSGDGSALYCRNQDAYGDGPHTSESEATGMSGAPEADSQGGND